MSIFFQIKKKVCERFYWSKRFSKYLPDRFFLECQWRQVWGYEIDWRHLYTLNEKLQWIKLHDRKHIYSTLVDKVSVKQWLTEKFGANYVIPTIAIFGSTEEIDLSVLPTEFILKTNHDSGHYYICRNKLEYNNNTAKSIFDTALKTNWYELAREWPYKNIRKHVIMCETLLLDKDGHIPNDYKLHYINGELKFVYVSFDRQGVNDRCTFDEDWNRLPFLWIPKGSYRDNMNTANVPCPKTFSLMKQFGREIAQLFKYVRVDFYDVDGKLYFGEITLFHGAGYDSFFPPEYDRVYGSMLKLK